ncbi:MAG: hypothetical protein JWM27_4341, partial [Gemmatimonadetes bacterium]|nr:hypothetical protein [Gemmatimonadota bacterium]
MSEPADGPDVPVRPPPGAWEASIDPALQSRLMRTVTRPGVARPAMLASVLARATGLGDRLPLLGQIARRQGVETARGPHTPVVHAHHAAARVAPDAITAA